MSECVGRTKAAWNGGFERLLHPFYQNLMTRFRLVSLSRSLSLLSDISIGYVYTKCHKLILFNRMHIITTHVFNAHLWQRMPPASSRSLPSRIINSSACFCLIFGFFFTRIASRIELFKFGELIVWLVVCACAYAVRACVFVSISN